MTRPYHKMNYMAKGMNSVFQDADDVNWDEYWSPNLTIDNALGDVREEAWHAIAHSERGEAWVYEKRRVKGAFLEYLELNQFPFDTQVCCCSILKY